MTRHLFNSRRAFTLIELLTVIAIIGILAAITFGALTGISEKNQISQARADMTAMSVALERYKATFGDYPRHGTEGGEDAANRRLLAALAGLAEPDGTALPDDEIRVPFLDLEALDISFASEGDKNAFLDDRSIAGISGVVILDPWGNPYRYFYDQIAASTQWRNPEYVLYSDGPDGVSTPAATLNSTGIVSTVDLRAADDNVDNVIAE